MTMPSVEAESDLYPARPVSHVTVMGLAFRNRLGIAAGVDRTGEKLLTLARLGCGHIEIGTITDPADLRMATRAKDTVEILGVNVGSARPGFSEGVLTDYIASLSSALSYADYVVLNFSHPMSDRPLTAVGACQILSAARALIEDHAQRGRRLPLLAKVNSGSAGDPLPISAAAGRILDGFVVAGDSTERLCEIRKAFPRYGLISVGGIRSAEVARHRMVCGADLVQSHHAAVEDGGVALAAILRGLAKDAADP
jgi:dihydroorotate dehydrogenase